MKRKVTETDDYEPSEKNRSTYGVHPFLKKNNCLPQSDGRFETRIVDKTNTATAYAAIQLG
jgi:hypothetical protein